MCLASTIHERRSSTPPPPQRLRAAAPPATPPATRPRTPPLGATPSAPRPRYLRRDLQSRKAKRNTAAQAASLTCGGGESQKLSRPRKHVAYAPRNTKRIAEGCVPHCVLTERPRRSFTTVKALRQAAQNLVGENVAAVIHNGKRSVHAARKSYGEIKHSYERLWGGEDLGSPRP